MCYSTRNFTTGWVSAHKRKCTMAITMVWSKSLWSFPENCTAKETQSGRLNSGGWQKDRSTHNSTTMWMWCVLRCTVFSCFTVVSELLSSHPVCMLSRHDGCCLLSLSFIKLCDACLWYVHNSRPPCSRFIVAFMHLTKISKDSLPWKWWLPNQVPLVSSHYSTTFS